MVTRIVVFLVLKHSRAVSWMLVVGLQNPSADLDTQLMQLEHCDGE